MDVVDARTPVSASSGGEEEPADRQHPEEREHPQDAGDCRSEAVCGPGASRQRGARPRRDRGNRGGCRCVYEHVSVGARDFESLFRTTFPRLVSLGVVKTGRADVARELAQEAMLRAYERWDELAGYDAPEAWCRLVMANLLVDHHRSRAAEQRAVERLVPLRSGAETAGSGAGGGGDGPAVRQWDALVEPVADRQRLIVTLYYAEDWSVGEIAAALDTSAGAVKAALFKARRTLRRRWGGEHDG